MTRIATRPLVDKTPFPNRNAANTFETPLPGEQKLAKLILVDTTKTNVVLLHPNSTPDSVARPSSMRKHVRAPRVSANFETPVTNGNHWDVSEPEIVVQEAQPAPQLPDSDDHDEVEYMPPKIIGKCQQYLLKSSSNRIIIYHFHAEAPYTPPFDLPNYSAVGTTLLNLAHSYPYEDDTLPAEIEPVVSSVSWDMFVQPEIRKHLAFLVCTTPGLFAS